MTNFLNNGTHQLLTLVGDVWEEIHTNLTQTEPKLVKKATPDHCPPQTPYGLKTTQMTSVI